jgi:hypothetical protein
VKVASPIGYALSKTNIIVTGTGFAAGGLAETSKAGIAFQG